MSTSWQLAAIIGVDYADRVRCQCNNCGRTVWKSVHLVEWADGRLECWGSGCFRRELGAAAKTAKPVFDHVGGRRLTAEERHLLITNGERLIAQFREEQRALADARAREEAQRCAEDDRLWQSVAKPKPTAAPPAMPSESVPRPAPPPGVGSGPFPPVRPGEPMRDPAYVEIREQLVKQWLASGVDLNLAYHRGRLIENALYKFDLLRGRRR